MAQPPAVPPEVAARHREIYRDLPGFEWEPLSARVACGRNPLSELDVRELAGRGVTHVLDLREPHEWEGPDRVGRDAVESMRRLGIDRVNFAIPDGGAPPPERISAIVDWIERAHAAPGTRIYVHCRGGVERTGATLLAWYAWHEDVDLETAQVELARRAPRLAPKRSQIAAVESWLRQERASGRRPHPRRRPVRPADFGGPSDFVPRRLPEHHVTIAVPVEVRLEPWEMRRVRLGFLPREMEEKWLLVWEPPHLRALRSWTGFEVFRLELQEHPDGSATWTHLLASRDREQYTGTDPDQDLQWAAALLSGLTGGRPLLRVAEDDEDDRADDEAGLEALQAWSMMGAGVSTRDPGIPL